MKIAVVGDVDHGKSTLIEGLRSVLERHGTGVSSTAARAMSLDSLLIEQTGEFTLDTTSVVVEVAERPMTLIDVPGHYALLKNMVTGASNAEAALVVVDVTRGIGDQTRRHVGALRLLGIDQCIVVFSKLDLGGYDLDLFRGAAQAAESMLRASGLRALCVVPVSALTGDNLMERSRAMRAYDGPSLVEALSSLQPDVQSRVDGLRFRIQDRYDVDGRALYVGRIDSGEITVGSALSVFPSQRPCSVVGIERFGERSLARAFVGYSVGLRLAIDAPAEPGDLLAAPPGFPLVADSIESCMMHLAAEPLRAGEELLFRTGVIEILCRVECIRDRTDSASGRIDGAVQLLHFAEFGAVTLSLSEVIACERFRDCPPLGRFVVMRDGRVASAGVITSEAMDGCAA